MFNRSKKTSAASKAHSQPKTETVAAPSVSAAALEFKDIARLDAFGQRARVDAAAFDEAVRSAERDRSLVTVLERIQAERVALLGELGHQGEIESAARRSVAEGMGVREALEVRARELRATREHLIADRQKKRAAAAQRSAEAGPAIHRALEQLWAAQAEGRRLENLIGGFASARLEWADRLRDMGLSDEEIAAVGVRPTDDDRAGWAAALELNRVQARQLSELLRGGPAAFLPEGSGV